MPDFLCNMRHLIHALLPGHAGAIGAVCKLVCIVAKTSDLANKFRVVCAGAGTDFFAQDEGAQIFLTVQTAGRNLPIKKG